MTKMKVDLNDIYFNFFEVLKIQNNDYDLGESEIKGVMDEYLKFISNEVFAWREKLDHEGVRHEEGSVKTPDYLKKLSKNFYDNGWFAIGCDEKIEGVPAPHPLVIEMEAILQGANASYSLYPTLSKSAMNLILAKGTDEQKELFLLKMMQGTWGGTMCLTEAGAGSDVGALRSTATPLGNGKYSIKGDKIFISSGESDLYENNVHLVLARTPDGVAGSKGISLFIVPRFRVDSKGNMTGDNDVVCTGIEEKMGIHGSATCSMSFGTNGKCEGELLGEEFSGMANMFFMMNEARLLVGNSGNGQASLAYEMAKDYALQRVQFGKEISKLADVKRMLLKMRSMCRGLRAMSMYVANLTEKEKRGDHSVSAEIAFYTPIFKVMGTERAYEIASDAVQVHGGYGFCSEYGVEQFIRDIKITTIYEGTTGIQAIDFVHRKILGDDGKILAHKLDGFKKKVSSLSGAKWKREQEFLLRAHETAEKTFSFLKDLAKNKKREHIMEHCNAILEIFGRLFLAEVILDHGILAEKSLESAKPEQKKFLESKIEDVACFTQMHLTQIFAFYEEIAYDASIEDLAIL